jgi:cell division protein FtsI/penicillin-binding protein 2
MPQRSKIDPTALTRPTWREYQHRLKKEIKKEKRVKTSLTFLVPILALLFVVCGLLLVEGWKWFHCEPVDDAVPSHGIEAMNKNDVRGLMGSVILNNLDNKRIEYTADGKKFQINTSIDLTLQGFLQEKVKRSIARNVGVVCLDPKTGRVLSMVGFDKTDAAVHPCVADRFPAASVFKIITAAAAIEQCGFNSNSKLSFNGAKHTLYKYQLKNRKNKYTNRITFMNAFAQSVNPVFGKIGTLYLKKENLKTYALIFGFNQDINFETQLSPSFFSISNDPYRWAEIASGFNRATNITPLHGALIAGVISNQGKLVEPTIVDEIINQKGTVVYRGKSVVTRQAIAPKTAKIVGRLMEETINTGTLRKTFKGYQKNKTLSRLDIGGKSGSIASPSNQLRYDWFVGFAKDKKGIHSMAVAALVTHQKYIGRRAGEFARIAMEEYFGNIFALK